MVQKILAIVLLGAVASYILITTLLSWFTSLIQLPVAYVAHRDVVKTRKLVEDLCISSWFGWHLILQPLLNVILALTLYFGSSWTRAVLFGLGIPYVIWAYLIDDTAENGRFPKFLSRLPWFKGIASYFPVTLHKTIDLDPQKKYIFCYHPHGVLFWGVVSCFASDGANFSTYFPNIDIRAMTLNINFVSPIFRECNKAMGACKVTWAACSKTLEKGAGSAILLIPGGAEEALYAYPGTMKLNLKRTRGFIKLALKQGAALVPVLGIGENEIYKMVETEPGTLLWKLQKAVQDALGFTVPIFWGEKLFGLPTVIPNRKPIHVVVGEPIEVNKYSGSFHTDMGKELIEDLYDKYMHELQALLKKNKHLFSKNHKGITLI